MPKVDVKSKTIYIYCKQGSRIGSPFDHHMSCKRQPNDLKMQSLRPVPCESLGYMEFKKDKWNGIDRFFKEGKYELLSLIEMIMKSNLERSCSAIETISNGHDRFGNA